MFASSYVETYNDPIYYKRKNKKRRNKTEQLKPASELIRHNDYISERIHGNQDIELEISKEQAQNLLKIVDSATKEEKRQNLKGRNIELFSKIRTGSSAFSAIPCKEIKFKKRHINTGNRSKTESQEVGSRGSIKPTVNGQSSSVSKEKFNNDNLNNQTDINKEMDSSYVKSLRENLSSNRENVEYKDYNCFSDYVSNLKTKHKTTYLNNNKSIHERIERIRRKERISVHINENSSAYTKLKTTEENESYHKMDEYNDCNKYEDDLKETIEVPIVSETEKKVDINESQKVPKLEIGQIKSISNSDAIKYELILKEMIEIENQLSFNNILIHYNLLEAWCNNVISGLKLKEEEFQNK